VDAWVVRKEKAVTILATNHAMPRHPIHTELTNLLITGAPQPRAVYIQRIDQDHADARQLWETMGEPNYLNAVQVEQLKATSCLVKQPQPWKYEQPNIELSLALPPHGVAAITIEFA
jgi:xylan 1,4-beta-xylosidase